MPMPSLALARIALEASRPMTSSISLSDPLRLGARQIDLVDHRKNFQIVIERHVHVGHRLRFDSLSRVDDEQRTLAGRQAARYFVSEIDVPGGVDQIELILFAVLGSVAQADRTGLDGNTALALEVHAVENLIGFLPRADRAGEFEQAGRPTSICRDRYAR